MDEKNNKQKLSPEIQEKLDNLKRKISTLPKEEKDRILGPLVEKIDKRIKYLEESMEDKKEE
jgi:hypothetical protein